MKDYFEKFYCPQTERARKLVAKNYALTKEIVAWKEKVADRWEDVKLVDDIDDNSDTITNASENVTFTMKVDTAGLGKDVKAELVVYKEEDGNVKFYRATEFDVVATNGDVLTYSIKMPIKVNGMFRYAFRVYPWNKNLPHRQDFAYLKWF